MTTTQGTSPVLLWPGLKEIFGDEYAQWEPEYDKIFDIENSDQAWEEYQEFVGLGLAVQKAEGQPTSYDDPIQGAKTTLTNLTYSLGCKITREMYQDGQYGKIRNIPKMMVVSVQQTVETLGILILDRAFNNSYTGGDGLELCSRLHVLPGGGTFANKPATDADASMTSYRQSRIDIASFRDGRNLRIKAMPKTFIVAKDNEDVVKKIVDSPMHPETAENAINPFNGEVRYMVSHWLADTDAWFLKTNIPGLVCQRRVWPAEYTKDNDFDTDVLRTKTYFRMVFGWYDPRAIYGSAGG